MYLFKESRLPWRRGTKCDCKTDWLWVRSPLEMKYLLKFIFQFLRSGVEGKRGVEFCLNTQCLQNSAESGERSVLTLTYPAECGIQREADLIWLFIFFRFGKKAKAHHWVPPFNTQCLENSANDIWVYMRDTAWKLKKNLSNLVLSTHVRPYPTSELKKTHSYVTFSTWQVLITHRVYWSMGCHSSRDCSLARVLFHTQSR